jgi:hypothetical protein
MLPSGLLQKRLTCQVGPSQVCSGAEVASRKKRSDGLVTPFLRYCFVAQTGCAFSGNLSEKELPAQFFLVLGLSGMGMTNFTQILNQNRIFYSVIVLSDSLPGYKMGRKRPHRFYGTANLSSELMAVLLYQGNTYSLVSWLSGSPVIS